MPLPTCRIDWRALSSVVDSADPDRDPDLVPLAHLSVKFTAGRTRIVTTSPPETVFLHPIEWKTDVDGYLVSPDGQRGLYLVASDIDPENVWTWTVRISSTPTSPHQITAVSYSFIAPSGGSIDLSTVIPVPAVPARDLPAWQEAVSTTTAARDETLVARDETLVAAATAQTAATTATNAATTAQTAATTATNAATTAAIGGFLSGTGSPLGVVSAPVGSQYRDTAATNGAVIWVKAAGTGKTGWVVQYGDTNWRDIAPEAPWVLATAAGYCRIKRSGDLVTLVGRLSPAADQVGLARTTARNVVITPTGFAPANAYAPYGAAVLGAISQVGGVIGGYASATHIGLYTLWTGSYAAGDVVSFEATWRTVATWPTVLPGTPAA